MKPDKRTAVFPGSFDPFTLGHMDVLNSALKLFDKIYIAVGYNHLKHGFLPPEVRVRLIRDAVRPLVESGKDIEVLSYTGLTVDLCREKNTGFIIRGLRTTTDFELESVSDSAGQQKDAAGDGDCVHPCLAQLFLHILHGSEGCHYQWGRCGSVHALQYQNRRLSK